jgi:hypothetical protein
MMDSNHVIPQKTANEWVQINQGADEIVHETVNDQLINDQLNELMNEKAPPSVQQARMEVPQTPLRDPTDGHIPSSAPLGSAPITYENKNDYNPPTPTNNESPTTANTPLPTDKTTPEIPSNLPEDVSTEAPDAKKVKRGPRGPYKKKDDDDDFDPSSKRTSRKRTKKKYTISDDEDNEKDDNYKGQEAEEDDDFDVADVEKTASGRPKRKKRTVAEGRPSRAKGAKNGKSPVSKKSVSFRPAVVSKRGPPKGISKGPTSDTLVITKEEYKRLAGVEKALLKVKDLNREMFEIMLHETMKRKPEKVAANMNK